MKNQTSPPRLILEQIGLLFNSFIWTTVVLIFVIAIWVLQDIDVYWYDFVGITPTPTLVIAEMILPVEYTTPTLTPTPTSTPSATPPITPTPLDTSVVTLYDVYLLPITPLEDDDLEQDVFMRPLYIPTKTAIPKSTPARQIISTPTVQVIPDRSKEFEKRPGMPTRLVIPSIQIDSHIIPVDSNKINYDGQIVSVWGVADYAVGWHSTSARPGEIGNTVMAGHHNIAGEIFSDLVNVEVGDEVLIYVGDKTYRYTVEMKTRVKEKGESLEVRQQNAQWIATTNDERLTMVTCWPYTDNTHRVIVVAKPSY